MKKRYRLNKYAFLLVVVVLVLCSTNAWAHEYDAIFSESIPTVEKVESFHELYDFATIPISPDDFLRAVMNDEINIEQLLGSSGYTSFNYRDVHADQVKRFTFNNVPIDSEPADVVVIRLGNDPSYFAFVFTCICGEWNLIDVLLDVHSVDIVNGSTDSWLIATTYAFQYTIEIETLYNLANRACEINYISHAAISVFDTPQFADGVIYISSNVKIDDFSIAEDDESVNHCYIFIVRNGSICSMGSRRHTEYAAETEIDIYEYDSQSGMLEYIQTNCYEDIGSATIDCLLRWDVLLPNTPVIKE